MRFDDEASKQATHRVTILNQALIISTQTDKEQYTRDILEEVDPLSPLGFLTTDIDEPQDVAARLEDGFGHSNRSRATVNDIVVLR